VGGGTVGELVADPVGFWVVEVLEDGQCLGPRLAGGRHVALGVVRIATPRFRGGRVTLVAPALFSPPLPSRHLEH
jgi:hypothetical protein